MNNSNMPIADILTIQLLQDVQMDESDQMRTYMFSLDIEKVSKRLAVTFLENGIDMEIPEEIFVDQFVSEIATIPGYAGFISFCEVDIDGIRDLGQKAYELLM